MSRTPSIALLKVGARDADPFAAAFREAGWNVTITSPLVVRHVNLDALREALSDSTRWTALVLTSPRACRAISAARPPADWAARRREAWTVGEATARAAREVGLVPEGNAGTAATLAEQIIAALDPAGMPRLLFPCAAARRNDLPVRLRAAGVRLEELVVYRTAPKQGPLLSPGVVPDWAAFFSPSGVRAALADADFPWNDVRLAAVGPTTAAALAGAGHPPEAVAPHPAPAALVAVVQPNTPVRA